MERQKNNTGGGLSRRGFLRGAAFGVGTSGLAAATWAAASVPTTAAVKVRGRPLAGYRETAHVRQAYALYRY